MARSIRVEYPEAYYHVMARGNERKWIYRDEGDRKEFLGLIGGMQERFDVRLLAYVLMPNHYHMVIRTPRANLSQALKWLQTVYAIRFNRKYRRSGHLFQGRFKAQVIDDDCYARTIIPYLHLNPIRRKRGSTIYVVGGIEDLDAYVWSSHRAYQAGIDPNQVRLHWEWLWLWGIEQESARRHYRETILRMIEQRELGNPWEQMRNGLVYGDETLINKVEILVRKKPGKPEQRWVAIREELERGKLVKEALSQETEDKWRIWLRVRWGGELASKLADEYGFSGTSGVMELIGRLERRAQTELEIRQKMTYYREALLGVESSS